MGVAESLLPGMPEEKRFNLLRGIFAAGYAIGVPFFFVPTFSITHNSIFSEGTIWLSCQNLVSMSLQSGKDVGFAAFLISLLLMDVAFAVLAFLKPLRGVFVAGAIMGVIGFCLSLIGGPSSPEPGVVFAMHPLATIIGVLCSVAAMLGFIIQPPASQCGSHSSGGQHLFRSSPTSDIAAGSTEEDAAANTTSARPISLLDGQPAVLWLSLGITGLLIIGAIFASGGFASQQPLAVSFRDSYVPGGGRVLVVKNTGSVLLQDCEVQVKAGNGQSFGPKRLGSLAAGEESELGWAELDGWVLEKGETITLSSRGYADKRIPVP